MYITLIILILGKHMAGQSRAITFALLLFCLGHGWWAVDSIAGNSLPGPLAKFYWNSWNSGAYKIYFPGGFSPDFEENHIRFLLKRISRVVDLRKDAQVWVFQENLEVFPEIPLLSLASLEMGYRASYGLPQGLLFDGGWVGADFDWRKSNGDYVFLAISKNHERIEDCEELDLMGKNVFRLWKSGDMETHGLRLLRILDLDKENSRLLIFKIDRDLPPVSK
jgi:hypothetical protein